MTRFVGGLILGAGLMAIAAQGADYDRSGNPAGPKGSVQQFDYFRQRQQQLDVGAMRRESDRQRAERTIVKPCDK